MSVGPIESGFGSEALLIPALCFAQSPDSRSELPQVGFRRRTRRHGRNRAADDDVESLDHGLQLPSRPARVDLLTVRVTPSEKRAFQRAADQKGLGLSSWIRLAARPAATEVNLLSHAKRIERREGER